MTDIVGLIRVLATAGVECIVVGGVAANLLGSARTTVDLDVVCRRSDENMRRLAAALAPIHPYLRDVPPRSMACRTIQLERSQFRDGDEVVVHSKQRMAACHRYGGDQAIRA
ncbi:MAG TPA: hypothetical protein VFV98_05530 [Vicinamibacterales bacterium]|nr:hypothetical protein [Vicinamibacterales bacterium]